MKKLVALILILSCILTFSACAEGKIKVTHKNLIVFEGDDSGYLYARIENTGDAAIGVGTGSLVCFTEDDEILLTESFIASYPSYITLLPGEYVYANSFIWNGALQDGKIADYKLSFEKYNYTSEYLLVPCEATFDLPGKDSYENYLYVTFTNPTDQIISDFKISAALYDAQNTLLFADGASTGSVAVHPSSSVTVRINVPNDVVTYYHVHNLVPTTVDALVQYEID